MPMVPLSCVTTVSLLQDPVTASKNKQAALLQISIVTVTQVSGAGHVHK